MKKQNFALYLSFSIALISCQVDNTSVLNSKSEDVFNVKSNSLPQVISSPIGPSLSEPPDDAPDMVSPVDATLSTDFQNKQIIDFETPPNENTPIEKGVITVLYHNNDKFRVISKDKVQSQNNSYANQINSILKKYNVRSCSSVGRYDSEDENKIVCDEEKRKKDHKIDHGKHDKDNNSGFNIKHNSENDDDNKHDKDCRFINYTDSQLTTQKIQEEADRVGQFFEGEFPDQLSIHTYEFPLNADTRKIAKEIRSLSFVRNSYPNLLIKSSASTYYPSYSPSYYPSYSPSPTPPTCKVDSTILGETYQNTVSPSSPNDSIFSDVRRVYKDSTFRDFAFSDNNFLDRKTYWFKTGQVFRALGIYGNTTMPTIAVIDNGFDIDGLDKPNYVNGFSVKYTNNWWRPFDINYGNSNVRASNSDIYNHGGMVASVIGSPKNNNQGVSGIAPSSNIIPIKLLNPSNDNLPRGTEFFDEQTRRDSVQIAEGIRKVINNSDVDAINISRVTANNNDLLTADVNIKSAVMDAISRNIVVVISAGNLSLNVSNVGRINGSIVVGGTSNRNQSNQSLTDNTFIWKGSNYGNPVDISAPSEGIIVPTVDNRNRRNYITIDGTSFAAPQIAATAGMVKRIAKSQGVNLSAKQVRDIVSYSGNTLYDPSASSQVKIGINLDNSNNNPSLKNNIRQLNVYNALTIAKNLGNKYNSILRVHNTDDYINSTNDGYWSRSFSFSPYKSDIIIGLKQNCYYTNINLRTLNSVPNTGYSYGYQLFYSGWRFLNASGTIAYDKADGSVGIFGAENGAGKPYGYYAITNIPMDNLY